jgi:hypothetical protein
MYLYVTSNVNNGHKIGITDNLLKRKIQYNTIFPDLEFLITIYSHDAAFIEESFKRRFFQYRKRSGNSDRRSEIYTLYLKIIAEHIIRCHHATGKALLIPENTLEAEFYNEPHENSTNFYLSNHYFNSHRDSHYMECAGITKRLIIASISPHTKEIKGKNTYGYLVSHVSLKGFKNSIKDIEKKSKKYHTYVPTEEWEEIDSFGDLEYTFFANYFDALNYIQEEIFLILLDKKIIKRPFDLDKINKFKEMRGFIYHHKAYYHEGIFFGKRFGFGYPAYKKFNLGIDDEKRRDVRKETYFPKALVKYGKG